MHTERIKVWSAFLIVSVVWGSTWLAIKIGLTTVPPFLSAGARFVVAALALAAIVRFRRLEIPLNPDAMKVYATLGVLSFSVPFALVYWAQQFIPSGLSSILFGAYPFWVAIFSHLLLRSERLDPWKVVGITLGFLGVVVIFSGDITVGGPESVPAMAAVLASTALQGFTLVVVKRYGQPISPFVMNLIGMTVGAVLLLGMAAAFEPVAAAVWNAEAVGSVLFLALVGSVVTFVSYYWLLKRIEAVYLSLTSFINPIVAVALGAAVLGEQLGPVVFTGAGLVLGGILAANGNALIRKVKNGA